MVADRRLRRDRFDALQRPGGEPPSVGSRACCIALLDVRDEVEGDNDAAGSADCFHDVVRVVRPAENLVRETGLEYADRLTAGVELRAPRFDIGPRLASARAKLVLRRIDASTAVVPLDRAEDAITECRRLRHSRRRNRRGVVRIYSHGELGMGRCRFLPDGLPAVPRRPVAKHRGRSDGRRRFPLHVVVAALARDYGICRHTLLWMHPRTRVEFRDVRGAARRLLATPMKR